MLSPSSSGGIVSLQVKSKRRDNLSSVFEKTNLPFETIAKLVVLENNWTF